MRLDRIIGNVMELIESSFSHKKVSSTKSHNVSYESMLRTTILQTNENLPWIDSRYSSGQYSVLLASGVSSKKLYHYRRLHACASQPQLGFF